VVLMVEQHLIAWFWNGPADGRGIFDEPVILVLNAAGGGAAPLFITLAGVGASLMVMGRQGQTPKGAGPTVDRVLMLRGGVILGYAYGLNLLAPGWFSLRSWYVLHLIGFGILTMPVWRRLGARALLAASALMVVVAGALQFWLTVPFHLTNDYMAGRSPFNVTEHLTLRLALVEGQFPLLPWLAFFLIGVVLARWLTGGHLQKIWILAVVAVGVGAGGAVGSWVAGANPDTIWGRSTTVAVPFFPLPPSLALLLIGGVVAVVALSTEVEARYRLRDSMVLVALGRVSLTVLIVHIWLFRELTRTGSRWQHWLIPDPAVPYFSWWHRFDVAPAVAGIVAILAVLGVLAVGWQRYHFRFGAEWLLRKVAP